MGFGRGLEGLWCVLVCWVVVVGSGGFGEFVLDWLWWALVGSGGCK